MKPRIAMALALALSSFCAAAADSGSIPASQAAASLRDDSFVRISFAGAEPVDALRLLPPEGTDPAAIVVVEGARVTVRPETAVGAATSVAEEPLTRPGKLEGTMAVKFGDGSYSRALFESGRAASFSLGTRDKELSLRYVVVPEVAGRPAGFAIAWRFYERSRLVESGLESVPLKSGQKEQVVLRSARGRTVASLSVEIAGLPLARKN